MTAVPEGPNVGGEDHERPRLQQGQRGGLQRVCGTGRGAHRRLQRLLPGAAEEEVKVDGTLKPPPPFW